MPVLFVHGIGIHDVSRFQQRFVAVRDSLRVHMATPLPPEAFFPVFWGDWGPAAWYRGRALETPHPKAAQAPLPADPALDTLQTLLAEPGPLRELLATLSISDDTLVRAAALSAGAPDRAALTVKRLAVRTRLLTPHHAALPGSQVAAGWDALRDVLALIFEPQRAVPKGLPQAFSYPLWAAVTSLARHMRAGLMQLTTEFLGDALAYFSRGAEVRRLVDAAVRQACQARPGEPVILIGHSLGGVIAYEYLVDPAFRGRPPARLLATVGAPVALFAEYGMLAGQTRGNGPPRPAGLPHPWLNIYDPDDLLSLPIGGVFPQHAGGDRSCASGKPFPASHSAYWENAAVIRAIAAALEQDDRR
ncbi:MAG: hypothetical protein HXY39_00755 [Chloroflexi bacterium]|nr:hypothetical protein [Chloroflexota bacterium]